MTAAETKSADLGDLGHWPRLAITRRSHKIIKHAYEHVVTACARLSAFSDCKPMETEGPVEARQEVLAVDDLVNFAIHARRLIENTAGKSRFRNVLLPSKLGKDSHPNFWTIISKLIHHQEIQVVRTQWHISALAGKEFWREPNRDFPPIVMVQSDNGAMVTFRLREFLEVFQKGILGPIIELCEEQTLYLDDSSWS